MQISRHWRMNARRYRLEGVRYEDDYVAIEERINTIDIEDDDDVEMEQISTEEAIAEVV